MANLKKILRTCIVCRKKFEQKELLRFKCENEKLVQYNNYGRSFYICETCSKQIQTDLKVKDLKRLEKILNKECKSKNNFVTQLKEILTDVR
ncbi:hypothetical protein GCM10012288_02090 [Malaciobacter pacificus]|uniref:Putative RNA-binding protein (DUF448 domain) n=1 Tax=Malaciobacter pacificus TaxID=1080223 RepID=A0A5C2H8C4_9BACT|nr:DUF448 domain-containing protein [Malaciobacter pacificus]QEP33466.1 putative RNA-binding protein (DUF448 domain) [Malaciobacter pacificus]GGD31719.1 hypothetical protein GCM10012288_02090 [Malaciobacter pacificus]